MSGPEQSPEAIADLVRHLRSELSAPPPQGFHFNDHVIRQDAALERMIGQLGAHPAAEVAPAVSRAIHDEADGWTQLKLLEVVERLRLTDTAPALISLVERLRAQDDERSRYLAGRACEVLISLPLNLELRARASDLSRGPLEDVSRFRMSAQRARLVHRPRRTEWALLVALMVLGLAGLVFAMFAVN